MARKNIFEGLEPQEEAPKARIASPRDTSKNPNLGALGALNSDLTGRNSRMVQDIDPERIDSSGHRDRMDIEATDIDALAQSISEYGQQVPVLVRPLTDAPGRFQIVYGRRRLAAVRRLGVQIKALVRTLSDEEAVLAQGQENSQRADPSFIEKAIFAADLREAGYTHNVILDALAIDKSALSRMAAVTASVPMEWIYAVGPAPDVGRRRWNTVAKALSGATPLSQPEEKVFSQATNSNERFDIFEKMITSLGTALAQDDEPVPSGSRRVDHGQPSVFNVAAPDGRQIAEVRTSGSALTLKVQLKQNPEFGSWLGTRMENIVQRLFKEWTENTPRAVEDAQDD